MINRFVGGGISRNLSERLGKPKPHVTNSHPVKILTPEMKQLLGPTLDVNSYHDQGIIRDQAASALEVFALSEDDIVEGAYPLTCQFLESYGIRKGHTKPFSN